MKTRLAYKLIRRIGAICIAALLIAAAGNVYAAGADERLYDQIAKQNDWETQILKIAQSYDPPPPSMELSALCDAKSGSCTAMDADPEAFQAIYELGPDAVPYILDIVEKSGENTSTTEFLVLAAHLNLHLFGIPCEDKLPYDAPDHGTPQDLAHQLRLFLERVPNRVDAICTSDATQEQKLRELNELGLAALPYLAERIQRGETEWEICFAQQMPGLSADERFDKLNEQERVLLKGGDPYALRMESAAIL